MKSLGDDSGKDAADLKNLRRNQNELADVKDILKTNIDKIVMRGTNLNELQASCWSLEVKAIQFQTTSQKVERKRCMHNFKYQLAIAIVVICFCLISICLVLIYFLVIRH